jgi:hypothetical protein
MMEQGGEGGGSASFALHFEAEKVSENCVV